MKKRYLILSVILGVLIIGAAIGGTMSYFTTYTDAKGGMPIHLGYQTRMREDFSAYTKKLWVANEEDSQPVFVRAKAIAASKYTLHISGDGWAQTYPEDWVVNSADGDYWYYQTSLKAGEETASPLEAKIDFPGNPEEQDYFTVLLVYESTPVKYHEDGTEYADWTTVLDVKESEGGN